MRAFDEIYEAREDRSFVEQIVTSIVLGIAGILLVLGAIAAVRAGAALGGGGATLALKILGVTASWLLAIALLLLLVGLLVRFAPAKRRPLRWVSFGALVSVFLWIAMSLAFGFYLTHIARYGSLFGNLATVFVVLQYLYFSSIAFLTGAEIDALVREEVEG
jgi:membrane protein